MADEPKLSEGAAPAFDAGAFMNELEGKIANVIDARMPKAPAISYPYGDARPVAQPAPASSADPMADLVSPYVDRAVAPLRDEVARANLRAQSAEDRAAFYSAHPDLKPEVKEKIENAFNRLAEAGSPFVREDILAWERGKNFDTYRKEAEAAEKAERDRVTAASTVGGHGVPLGSGMGDKDWHQASDDEIKLAMTGKVF